MPGPSAYWRLKTFNPISQPLVQSFKGESTNTPTPKWEMEGDNADLPPQIHEKFQQNRSPTPKELGNVW